MVGIAYKSTNAIKFHLKNGKNIEILPEQQVLVNILSESDFEALMNEYGDFIKKRTFSESNPTGCFAIGKSQSYASDMSKEIGEVKDASAPIEVEQPEVKEEQPLEIKEIGEVKDASAPKNKGKRKK